MTKGQEISMSNLSNNNTDILKIGDVIKNNTTGIYYVIINLELCEDSFYSYAEGHSIHCKDYENTLEDNIKDILNQLGLFNLSDKVQINSLYRNYYNFTQSDFEQDEIIYIGHLPIKKETYIVME